MRIILHINIQGSVGVLAVCRNAGIICNALIFCIYRMNTAEIRNFFFSFCYRIRNSLIFCIILTSIEVFIAFPEIFQFFIIRIFKIFFFVASL